MQEILRMAGVGPYTRETTVRASELRFAIYVVTSHRRTEDSEKKLEMPTNLEILAYF